MWTRRIAMVCAFGVMMTALAACGPPPKPAELKQLETMRNDSYTGTIVAAEPQMLDKADKFYKMAVKAWQEGDLPRAKEYGWLGQLRYRTAEARTHTKEEKARQEKAAKETQDVQHEIEVTKVQVESVGKSITLIEQTIQAKSEKNSAAAKSEADQVVLAVEAAREKARGVNAMEHAAGPFNMAENILNLSQEHLAAGRLDEAMKQAEEARLAYEEAYAAAKIEFDKISSKQAQAEREKALYDAAQKGFSINALQDGRGVVVLIPRLFDKSKTSPLDAKIYMLDQAAEIALAFPETTVMIEGYTQSKGSDSKNLTISQSRADSVRDYLLRKGVGPKRLTSTGYGEERARYDNKDRDDRGKNDRVEIIFLMPKS